MISGLSQVCKRIVAKTFIPLLLFQWIRIENHLLWVRWNNRLNPYKIWKRFHLKRIKNLKLHWACGTKILPDWINIDGWSKHGIDYVMDLRCKLPFEDNSVNYVFMEHALEHFSFSDGISILHELYRVMTSRGVIRIIVPDLERYCSAYSALDRNWFKLAGPKFTTLAEGINYVFFDHFHRFMYDFESLSLVLSEAGFHDISKSTHLTSEYKELRQDTDLPNRKALNLYVEAHK
jgi:predicted SAM-dependent methyltransferase